jgi:hypothetical protein
MYSIEDSLNIENKGLLQSMAGSEDQIYKNQYTRHRIEEKKGQHPQESDSDSNEEIKFFNDEGQKQLSRKGTVKEDVGFSDKDALINELKKTKLKFSKIAKKGEKYSKVEIDNYNQKFENEADEEMMDVGAVDLAELETEFGMIEDERERKKKQRELEFEHRKKGITLTAEKTQNQLVNTQTSLLKEIAQEEIEARKKAEEREKIIKNEFRRVESRISGVIKQQRSKILGYFGPLVQEKKKSAYQILGSAKKKVDLSARTRICLPFSIKIKLLRCVKDKIDPGTYVVLAEVIDRIGGVPIVYNYQRSMKNLEKLKRRIKDYEALKLRFLKEQKIDVSTQESEELMQKHYEDQVEEESKRSKRYAFDQMSQDKSNSSKGFEIDLDRYEKLRFLQRHTKYREFYGSFQDEEFFVDENLFLLYPPMNRARPSNCIQFRVIKLSNETSLDDKVVGWGVFPILNSELAFNEGRFKIPMMQGNVDEGITLYQDIQGSIMKDLDTWL